MKVFWVSKFQLSVSLVKTVRQAPPWTGQLFRDLRSKSMWTEWTQRFNTPYASLKILFLVLISS